MKISLVLCTIGRDKTVGKFIDSIINSVYDIELIIVDQNSDDRITNIVETYSFPENISIIHLKPELNGLSKARNYGIKYITGDIYAFPDDDCVYGETLLDYVINVFGKSSSDFFSCRTKDFINPHKSLITCSNERFDFNMSRRAGCSFTLFFKKNHRLIDLRFDERMGVGSGTLYGAGEESDYLTQALYTGAVGYYYPDEVVYHEAKEELFTDLTLKRLESYGGGYAFHIRKNYKKLGLIYTVRLISAIPARLIKTCWSKERFIKSIFFTKGAINGFFR
ncbi:glycosyltransferase family 2 protein [Aeromonas veronii]|uniref:glycosyltransferase family 2 protein n=1 Tax=Aeromonas veronii TaxID=654 RepID=UPI002B466C54|nr:glycosyltransferase family 2 protein [Aeromonas veronii]